MTIGQTGSTAGRARAALRGVAALLGAVALALGAPVLAHAHVGVDATSTAAGSSTLLTFAFSHGCDGSPTTAVAIRIPDGINAVAPTINPGWDVQKVTSDLEPPVTDGHGNQVTQRVSEVRYTARTPIPDGLRDALVLSLKLPEDAAGTTLAFPTVQSCEQGEHAWIEIAADGQDPHDLDAPAPLLAVTVATPAGNGHDTSTPGTSNPGAHDQQHDEGREPSDRVESGTDSDQSPLAIVSLIIGTLGLATGVTALVRSRSRR